MTVLIVLAVLVVIALMVASLADHHDKHQQAERLRQYQNHISEMVGTAQSRMRETSNSYLDHIRGITRR